MSRSEWLRLGVGTLLATGLLPGCARFSARRASGHFSFVVMNDTHFQSPERPAWFERVVASIRAQTPRPEFVVVVGDLAEHGTREELGGMRAVLQSMGIPFYVVIGNHDWISNTDRSAWTELYPQRMNYDFRYRGWQFICLDTTDGLRYRDTHIQPATLAWVDQRLRRLDRKRPTVVFTHFPLGAGVKMRPLNADELLDRFRDVNLVAVFSGHHHGLTDVQSGGTTFVTNRCCAISRGNHDGSPAKGYFLCTTEAGALHREFVEVHPG